MFSLADKKIKLIILAVAGIPILIIVFRFLPITNSLEKLAENNLKKAFEESSIPYKDISVKVVENDGTRAVIKEIFTVQHKCLVVFDKENHGKIYGSWISASSFNEEWRAYGVTALSKADYELLGEMGLIATTYDLKEENEAKIKWKRCYVFREYVKSGNEWSKNVIGPIGPIHLDAWGYILPPQEQKKLGYKITDEMRKKVSSDVKGNRKTLEGETYTGQKFTVSYPAEYKSSLIKDTKNCRTEDGPCTYYLLTASDTQGNHFIFLGPKYRPYEPPSGYPPKELQAVTVDGQNFTLEVIKAKDLKDYKDFIEAVVAPSNSTSSNFKGEPLFKLISQSADEKYLTDFRQVMETLQIK